MIQTFHLQIFHTREMKAYIIPDTGIQMFIVAKTQIIAKTQKQLKSLSRGELINKGWHIYTI